MNEFRFAQPQYGHLLWLILLLAIALVWLELRGRSALDRFLSSTMQPRLVHTASMLRRLIAVCCLLLGLGALVLAAMRPQWGATQRMLPRAGAQIMICLDVSKSMLAEDAVPNRLERAKAEIADLLDLMQGEQVGLIAFAGNATVLSPMTSDFGFLKLMLDNVGVQSVGRGGTRLEEPIRKAVDGFGEAADISRVILLITDGEDHDSFPLDAADGARERGIKIVTIGFGDEAGSKIETTDRRTGARKFVTDHDGSPVLSRLDGATLREIALKTGGAYIPAGTGALDLASIHRQHIAPLVRGELESGPQIIRHEAFQWAILIGLLLIVLSIAIRRGISNVAWAFPSSKLTAAPTAAATIVLVACALVPWSAMGQVSEPEGNSSTAFSKENMEKNSGVTLGQSPEDEIELAADEENSREVYNQSLPLLASNVDAAETLLQQARRNAGSDGEVRYRSAYNLGWVEATRADQLIAEDPKQALVHLRSAADWFRQSIRIRPKDTDARHNLEIVMRRALELADSLAKKDQADVAERLDGLIKQQRGLVDEAGSLVERLAAENARTPDSEMYRRDFRTLATHQRQILSDAQALTRTVAEEQTALSQKVQSSNAPDQQLDDEERMRLGQLEGVGEYLQRAIQRMGQSRGQLRRKQDQRAFRRASTGLSELKRARDMLRPPHDILKMLAQETKTLMRQTGTMAENANTVTSQRSQPSWLTDDYLKESQQTLSERTREWTERMSTALGDSDTLGPPQPGTAAEQEEKQQQEQLAATQLVVAATQSFAAAESKMAMGDFVSSVDHQQEAYVLISDALELFLDLKGLIEATYATEQRIEKSLHKVRELPEPGRSAILSALSNLQEKNLRRADRLQAKLRQERENMEQSQEPQPAGPPAPGGNASVRESNQAPLRQLDLAEQLLEEACIEMNAVDAGLRDIREEQSKTNDREETVADNSPADSATTEKPAEIVAESPQNERTESSLKARNNDIVEGAQTATQRLQDLRRLFYSVVEHLQETAQRQSEINDQTQQLSGEQDRAEQQNTLGPLLSEQQELDQLAQQIAQALQEQSATTPPQSGQSTAEQQQATEAESQRFREASQLVQQAAEHMQTSLQNMDAEELPFAELRQSQDDSLAKLTKALALLVPPQEQNNDQNQQQDQQQPQQNQQQDEPEEPSQENLSMNQLLQLIRDRDAQRRRDKEKHKAVGTAPVEKDW